MGVVFLGQNDDGDDFEVIGRVEDGEIVEDTDGELEETLEDMPLQDGYLSAKFDNHYLNAALTEDVWDEEIDRIYVDDAIDAPEGVELEESEYGALYYVEEEESEDEEQ